MFAQSSASLEGTCVTCVEGLQGHPDGEPGSVLGCWGSAGAARWLVVDHLPGMGLGEGRAVVGSRITPQLYVKLTPACDSLRI